MILFRPIRVLAAFLPFLLSLLRDRRKWVLFGIPRVLSEEQRKARAVRLRGKIASLGPTFIKGAQVLGMREDLIPKIYTEELKKLQDQAPAFSFSRVKRIIEGDLGSSLNDIFEQFDEIPVAAASLGQVHKAVYKGRYVAVKIIGLEIFVY